MSILEIFFDGWGLGADDPGTNPFLSAPLPTLYHLLGGSIPSRPAPIDPGGLVYAPIHFQDVVLVPTDATLGIPGLPQSATGQTTLFTGVNAASVIGQHLGPYPNAALRKILSHQNIFQQLMAADCRVAFANAYPPIFFERLGRNSARRSATSYAVHAAGVRYRNIDDLRAGHAVSAFVTNDRWVEAGADVPRITPRQAGHNLARLAREHDYTLFEYFLTDAAGHKGKPDFIAWVLAEIDQLLAGVLDEMDLSTDLIVTTSDHGNLEDSSAKGHTLNPVPTLLIGTGREQLASRIRSLVDLTPTLFSFLTEL